MWTLSLSEEEKRGKRKQVHIKDFPLGGGGGGRDDSVAIYNFFYFKNHVIKIIL
jgi:hypothetical protein